MNIYKIYFVVSKGGINNEGITVAINNGILIIEILQFPGGKPLEVKEFLKGNKIEKGIVLS